MTASQFCHCRGWLLKQSSVPELANPDLKLGHLADETFFYSYTNEPA
jgi:hypothetical protein